MRLVGHAAVPFRGREPAARPLERLLYFGIALVLGVPGGEHGKALGIGEAAVGEDVTRAPLVYLFRVFDGDVDEPADTHMLLRKWLSLR